MVPTSIRVIYGDTDQMGVVYYANYLRYFEAGRTELIRASGLPYRELEERYKVRLPVVEAHVEYRQSARYDDLLRVETTLAEVRRASVRFEYRIVRPPGTGAGFEPELLVTGHTVHVCVGEAGKACRMPRELADGLTSGQPTHRFDRTPDTGG